MAVTKRLRREILSALRFGVPVRVICERLGCEIHVVENGSTEWKDAVARARKVGASLLASDTLTIADNAEEEPQSIAKARLRIGARQWLAARMDPARFGETRHLTVDADVTVRRTSFQSFLGTRVIEVEEATEADLLLPPSRPSALVTGLRASVDGDALQAQANDGDQDDGQDDGPPFD